MKRELIIGSYILAMPLPQERLKFLQPLKSWILNLSTRSMPLSVEEKIGQLYLKALCPFALNQ